ncbi:hypothetical protein [Conexibacter arvalis]|uniref:DUF4430 domain-containing protein n=1 Tax=Conexibacter arvalis TaxID=912552 RepID=A0A840IKT3_9ACTN|nr:hypothetical protein [Conexibacter arvalis]MBB4664743.1 hypothetical protein [Conexibacter arvalis]
MTVRVEGPSATLADARVTTSARAVAKDGEHACSGTSAAGALELATKGRWSASYNPSFGYFLTGVGGVAPSGSDYWVVWLNGRSSMTGLCDTELQNGDELLLFVCEPTPDYSGCTNRPLGIVAPRGRSAAPTVRVVAYAPDGTTTPVPGATVSGGTKAVRTDARGRAKVTLAAGQSSLRATRDSDVPSAPLHCAAGRCGSSDVTAPTVKIAGLPAGKAFAAGKAPRALRGTAADPSGAKVELRLTRRAGGACTVLDGRSERFVPCKRRAAWVAAGDRRRWSYLLPSRLAPGRYTLQARATDGAGNVGRAVARFTVRARGAQGSASAVAVAVAVAAASPRVATKVVGKRGTVFGSRTVTASATTVKVGRKRCAVPAGTPLAALLAADRAGAPAVKVADYGSCGRRAANSGGLYVTQVGSDRRRGQAGWVYAVNGRVGTAGAADPSGPFGSGRLRGGQKVVWFWCARANSCTRVPR